MTEYKNLEKFPSDLRDFITRYLDELFKIYHGKIEAIFAYGSIVTGEWVKNVSDVNLLIVVDDVNISKLEFCLKLIKKGTKKKITTPLFLTKQYIETSLDTFPMEFLEFKENHLLVYGEDFLKDLEIGRGNLRLEVEHQLKANLLRLRQVYLEIGLRRKGFEKFTKSVISNLMPAFRNLLRLKQIDPPPLLKEEIIKKIGEEFQIEIQALLDVLEDKKNDEKIKGKKIEYYLEKTESILKKLSQEVDKI
jgi:predicted nucleotidyltransferase